MASSNGKESLDKIMMAYADLTSNPKGSSFKGPALKDVQVKKSSGPSFQPSQKARDWSSLEQSLESAFGTTNEDEFSDFVGPTPVGTRLATFQAESPVHLFKPTQNSVTFPSTLDDDDFGDFAAPPPLPPPPKAQAIPQPSSFLAQSTKNNYVASVLPPSFFPPKDISKPFFNPVVAHEPPIPFPSIASDSPLSAAPSRVIPNPPVVPPVKVQSNSDKYSALRDLLSPESLQDVNVPNQLQQTTLKNPNEEDDDFGDFVTLPVLEAKDPLPVLDTFPTLSPVNFLMEPEDQPSDLCQPTFKSLLPIEDKPIFNDTPCFQLAGIKSINANFVPWHESSPPPMLPDDNIINELPDDDIRSDIVYVEQCLEPEQPDTINLNRLKIIASAKTIFQNALDTFASIEDLDVRAEVLEAPETAKYAYNLSQICQMLYRLQMEDHEEFQTTVQVWAKLNQHLPGLLHVDAQQCSSDIGSNLCKICLKYVKTDLNYHSSCANFWINVVAEPLPN